VDSAASWILDRTWYEDAEIFARGLFEQGCDDVDEWTLYRRLYAELLYSPAARPPRLLVFIARRHSRDSRGIATRGRPKERDVAVDYWSRCTRATRRGSRNSGTVPCCARRSRLDLLTDGRHRGCRGAGARGAGGRVAADGALAASLERAWRSEPTVAAHWRASTRRHGGPALSLRGVR
jgi:hypothetical protein